MGFELHLDRSASGREPGVVDVSGTLFLVRVPHAFLAGVFAAPAAAGWAAAGIRTVRRRRRSMSPPSARPQAGLSVVAKREACSSQGGHAFSHWSSSPIPHILSSSHAAR
jgi:hypothetical protein